jgi:hypothetical protein
MVCLQIVLTPQFIAGGDHDSKYGIWFTYRHISYYLTPYVIVGGDPVMIHESLTD